MEGAQGHAWPRGAAVIENTGSRQRRPTVSLSKMSRGARTAVKGPKALGFDKAVRLLKDFLFSVTTTRIESLWV